MREIGIGLSVRTASWKDRKAYYSGERLPRKGLKTRVETMLILYRKQNNYIFNIIKIF